MKYFFLMATAMFFLTSCGDDSKKDGDKTETECDCAQTYANHEQSESDASDFCKKWRRSLMKIYSDSEGIVDMEGLNEKISSMAESCKE